MGWNSSGSCRRLHPSLPGLQRVGLWVNPKHGHTFKISKTAGSKISYPLDPEFLGLSLEPIRFSDFCPPPFFPKQKWTNHFIASVARPTTTVTCETTVEQTGTLYKEKNLSAHLDWSNDFICVRNAKNACSVNFHFLKIVNLPTVRKQVLYVTRAWKVQFELKAKERSAKERSANPSGPIFPPRREQRKTVQSIQKKEKGQERHNQLLHVPPPQTKQLRVVPVNAHDPDARINLRF